MTLMTSRAQAVDFDYVENPGGERCRVRTVRLALDPQDTQDAVLLARGERWATMAWEPGVEAGSGREVRRYASESAALAGHKAVCQEIVHGQAVVRV